MSKKKKRRLIDIIRNIWKPPIMTQPPDLPPITPPSVPTPTPEGREATARHLEAQNENMGRQLAEANERCAKLEEENAEIESSRKKIYEDFLDKSSSYDHAVQMYNTELQEKKRAEEHCKKLVEERNQLKTQLDEANKTVEHLQIVRDGVADAAESVRQQDVDVLSKQLGELKSENERLRAANELLTPQVVIDNTDAEVDLIEHLQNENASYEKQVADANHQLRLANESNEKLESACKSYEQECHEKGKKIRDLEGDLEDVISCNQKLAAERDEWKESSEGFEGSWEARKAEANAWKSATENARKERDEARKEVAALKLHRDELLGEQEVNDPVLYDGLISERPRSEIYEEERQNGCPSKADGAHD